MTLGLLLFTLVSYVEISVPFLTSKVVLEKVRFFAVVICGVATATITNIRRRGNNGSVYQPVYEYFAEGQMRKVASRWASNIIVAESGSEIELFYIPGKPEKIYVPKEHKTSRILIIGIGFISIMDIVLGTAIALGLIRT